MKLKLYRASEFSKAREGLVPVQRQVNRNGKVYMQTFYVRPDADKKAKKKKKDKEPLAIPENVKLNVLPPDNKDGEVGYYIAVEDEDQGYSALRVPEDMVSHSFKIYGRTFTVHRAFAIKDGERVWDILYNVTESNTGRTVLKGDGTQTIEELESEALELLNAKHEKLEQAIQGHDTISDLPMLDKKFEAVLSRTQKGEKLLALLDQHGRKELFERDMMDAIVNNQSSFKDNMEGLELVLNFGTYDQVNKILEYSTDRMLGFEDARLELELSKDIISDMIKHKPPGARMDIDLDSYMAWLDKINYDPAKVPEVNYHLNFDDYPEDNVPTAGVLAFAYLNSLTPFKAWRAIKEGLDEDHIDLDVSKAPYLKNVPVAERIEMMTTGSVRAKNEISGAGINGSYRMTLSAEDSDEVIVGLWKPSSEESSARESSGIEVGSYYFREELAYKIASALGSDLIPPTIAREINGQWGSFQEWRYNYKNFADTYGSISMSHEKKMEASVLDFVMGNTDRHDNNYMVSNDTGEVILIDNGLCFPENDRYYRFQSTEYYQEGSFDEATLKKLEKADWAGVLNALDNSPLSSKAVGKVEQRIQWMLNTSSLPSEWEVAHSEWQNTEVTTNFRVQR